MYDTKKTVMTINSAATINNDFADEKEIKSVLCES